MAASHFANSDFINAHTGVKQLIQALESEKTKRKGVRTSGSSANALLADVQKDVVRILQSPLRRVQPSGYGALPLDAVQSLRGLHNSVSTFLSQSGSNEAVAGGGEPASGISTSDLQDQLASLVGQIDQDHPFLKSLQAERKQAPEEWQTGKGPEGIQEDDEDEEAADSKKKKSKGKGKGKVKEKLLPRPRKTKTKQKKKKDKKALGVVQTSAIAPIRRSERVKKRKEEEEQAKATEANDLINSDWDESESD